jgi:hypothetical protein
MFYKGVDKRKVDAARLSQTHGQDLPALREPRLNSNSETPPSLGQSQPPYLFHNGASLLAMTRKYNVSICTSLHGPHVEYLFMQKTIAQLVYDNELHYLEPVEIRTLVLLRTA